MKFNRSRRFSSTTMTVFIILSTFAVMNFASMNVLADEFWNGGHTVSGTEWYENCVIEMQNGDLTIPNGTTLIFGNDVSFIIYCSSPGQYGIEIAETGKFIVNSTNSDTTLQSDPANPGRTYPFTNSGTIDFLGATV